MEHAFTSPDAPVKVHDEDIPQRLYVNTRLIN
jgi:hypothetical protein